MKRVLLEICALALIGGGIYRWKHPPEAPRKPLFAGEAPALAMPASGGPAPRNVESAMLLEHESLAGEAPGLNGKRRKPRALGNTPRLFDKNDEPKSTSEPTANQLDSDRPSLWERLYTPWGLGAVFCVFVVFYGLLSRALHRNTKGPFTHD